MAQARNLLEPFALPEGDPPPAEDEVIVYDASSGRTKVMKVAVAAMSDVKRRIWYDPDADTLYSHVRQDVEPRLEENARLRSEEQRSDFMRHTASIPVVILEGWLNDEFKRGNTSLAFGTKEFDALIKRKLADPEWAYLKVAKPIPAYRR